MGVRLEVGGAACDLPGAKISVRFFDVRVRFLIKILNGNLTGLDYIST